MDCLGRVLINPYTEKGLHARLWAGINIIICFSFHSRVSILLTP